MKLVEISAEKHNVIIDLKYASEDNILEKIIFLENKCLLHPKAEEMLVQAVNIASSLQYRLKIFDAYRPQYVQESLWSSYPNPNFLSDPKKGSPHTRGIAVDLTLADINQKELDMGTKFDDFSKKAYHLSKQVSITARKNRYLLLSIMTLAGFDFYHNEWWHYQLFNPIQYQLIPNL